MFVYLAENTRKNGVVAVYVRQQLLKPPVSLGERLVLATTGGTTVVWLVGDTGTLLLKAVRRVFILKRNRCRTWPTRFYQT